MYHKSNSYQMCIFCGKKGRGLYYNSKIGRYVCRYPMEYCPAFKLIVDHLRNCQECSKIYKSSPLKTRYHHSKYNKCIDFMILMRTIRNKKITPFLLKSKLLRDGVGTCQYCGERARYLLYGSILCCSPGARQCPNYSKRISQLHREKYKKNPELRKRMSKIMKKVQNRPEVKKAKSLKMIHLHNDNCKECREFRNKYRKAQRERRGDKYYKYKYYRELRKERKKFNEQLQKEI